MHEAIILSNWPSCLNCLAWSQDCLLAVAAGETVELLVPVVRAHSDDVETGLEGTQQWTNVHLRTNLFTSTEVPPIDPLSSRANSLGEEISVSEAAAVEWSPPGLAKHARCALAVLTTNLTLSLWVSDSDPRVARSWKRALIVNHEVERYCQELYGENEQQPDLDWEIRRRLRRRVRSFAWSPQIRTSQAAGASIQDAESPVNGSFIAVSTDDNDVVILRIHSPHSFFSPSTSTWSAHAVAHFSYAPKLPLSDVPRPILFDEHMSEQRHIGNLAWSPWTTSKDDVPEAFLAYTTNFNLHLRRIRIEPFSSKVSLDQNDVFSDDSVGTGNTNLLRWMPKASGECLFLIAFSRSGAVCYEVPVGDPANITISKHDLDSRWDLIAGCAFNGFEPRIQFTSQLSAPVAPTSEFKLPIPADTEEKTTPFQQSICESERLFSAEHELGGHTLTKTWGMCTSPMGDLVASGLSFHPGDMVEYTIAAASRTHIGIQPFDERTTFSLPSSGGLCPVEDVSAEALLYSVKTWLEEQEAGTEESTVRDTILSQFWIALGLSESSGKDAQVQPPEVKPDGLSLEDRAMIVQALRRRVYFAEDILKQRYGRLLALFFNPKGTTQSDDAPAIQKLVTETLRLPRTCYSDSQVSRKIRSVYSAMLPWLGDAETDGTGDAVETSADKHVEECEICDDSIGFESFAWARCGQGHEFVRCSLTFLAIQAPGISKLCGICGKRYLDEQHIFRTDQLIAEAGQQDAVMLDADNAAIPPTETQGGGGNGLTAAGGQAKQGGDADDNKRSPITMARILFEACDVCLYCGGKFVG